MSSKVRNNPIGSVTNGKLTVSRAETNSTNENPPAMATRYAAQTGDELESEDSPSLALGQPPTFLESPQRPGPVNQGEFVRPKQPKG